MARQCMITLKKPMSGNNVSHAQNKTRRRFNINLQDTTVYSESLKQKISIRTTADGLRTLEHKGGFDAFIKGTAKTKLHPALRKYKALIEGSDTKAAA